MPVSASIRPWNWPRVNWNLTPDNPPWCHPITFEVFHINFFVTHTFWKISFHWAFNSRKLSFRFFTDEYCLAFFGRSVSTNEWFKRGRLVTSFSYQWLVNLDHMAVARNFLYTNQHGGLQEFMCHITFVLVYHNVRQYEERNVYKFFVPVKINLLSLWGLLPKNAEWGNPKRDRRRSFRVGDIQQLPRHLRIPFHEMRIQTGFCSLKTEFTAPLIQIIS